MPEIKFRAWLKKKNKMIYPYVLDFLHKTWIADKDLYGDFDDIVLMSSTGLSDDNDAFVYEGDIVEYVTGIMGYKSTYHTHRTVVKYKDGGFYPFPDADIVAIKVIGNIYENTDLLDSDV